MDEQTYNRHGITEPSELVSLLENISQILLVVRLSTPLPNILMFLLHGRRNPRYYLPHLTHIRNLTKPRLRIPNQLPRTEIRLDDIKRLLSEPPTPHNRSPPRDLPNPKRIPIRITQRARRLTGRIILRDPRDAEPLPHRNPHARRQPQPIAQVDLMVPLVRKRRVHRRLHEVPEHLADIQHAIDLISSNITPERAAREPPCQNDRPARRVARGQDREGRGAVEHGQADVPAAPAGVHVWPAV